MIVEEQSDESSSQSVTMQKDVNSQLANQSIDSDGSDRNLHVNHNNDNFIAKVRQYSI